MTPAFKKFLRQAIGGRSIERRKKLLRAFIRAKCANTHPEYGEEQVLTFVQEHFEAWQADPPNIEYARGRFLAFRAEQRKAKAQKAANARWTKKDLVRAEKVDSGNNCTRASASDTRTAPEHPAKAHAVAKSALKHGFSKQNCTRA